MLKVCFIRDLEDDFTVELSKLKEEYLEKKLGVMLSNYELKVISLDPRGRFVDWFNTLRTTDLSVYDVVIGYRLGATLLLKMLQFKYLKNVLLLAPLVGPLYDTYYNDLGWTFNFNCCQMDEHIGKATLCYSKNDPLVGEESFQEIAYRLGLRCKSVVLVGQQDLKDWFDTRCGKLSMVVQQSIDEVR